MSNSYNIVINPDLSGVNLVTVTREDDTYWVFSANGKDGLTAEKGAPADAEADIRGALEAWSNPTPLPIPAEVGPAQLRIAMRRAAIDPANIDSAIAEIADPVERANAGDLWHRASTIKREHPLIANLAAAMGLTTEQVDDVFRDAEGI